ncbi:unnamed protein product [Cyprideis torosa]|uniref:Coatomer subunit beta n=1 Tax=Cyprideis torosa TaxID=163714 RepID=A0A7R8W3K3_9CRUS|nr:unnamed protein product [Cyprideis torosa]CAG0879752.1 unnamed protein product [Cyprideis torosa]
MSTVEQPCYTLINLPSDVEVPNEVALRQDLEKGDVRTKTEALKKVIHLILSGEKLPPGFLMTIIRFVLPLQDHTVKKLLLVFWEIVPKTFPDGRLLQEMILVCDAYRKDLQHPNEFIRGSTLRFLCKLKEPELLEPLMPAIRACLEHRHSYVRRNAVLAIFQIYKNFDFLIPDAPDLIFELLQGEQDMSTKRNAFMMLIHAHQERALEYLSSCIDQASTFASVRYEAAGTLVTLSSAPTAIRAAASCYIDLIVKEADNNVKLIVLDRLIALREHPAHEKVLQELVMDILRVLGATDLEVRKKTLDLALDLVTSRSVEELILVLKKEVSKTHNVIEHENSGKYRQLLVRTLHSVCMKFPDVSLQVIPVLMEFLSDTNELAATDVLVFVREAIQKFPNFRAQIIQNLLESFPTIRSVAVHRAALWILGEYAATADDIQSVMTQIRQSLGELPIVESELKKKAGEETDADQLAEVIAPTAHVQKLVTADGTYATQSAFSAVPGGGSGVGGSRKEKEPPPLRKYVMKGEFYIAATLATTLAKLSLRYRTLITDTKKINRFAAEAMLIMASILHLGKSGLSASAMTNDVAERIQVCLQVLAADSPMMSDVFIRSSRQALDNMLKAKTDMEDQQRKSALNKKRGLLVQPDDPISFQQLLARNELGDKEDIFELSLTQAVGSKKPEGADLSSSKLSKVLQLTGFSDPVYAEAYVNVNQYDIVLDVLIVNQTSDTLQNCTLELATLGDLKLVEKPSPLVLAPHDFCNIKASVKVSSTENGIIFGNIVYDVTGAASDRNVVVLNDIHIDIMDYIVPASCTDTEFRQLWADLAWENKVWGRLPRSNQVQKGFVMVKLTLFNHFFVFHKVSVNTNITELRGFLEHLIQSTNMRCLTPSKALSGDCGFMAANLYAKSIFGEDALANLSIEKPLNKPDGPVVGHIRIRAKSQGMALSLGEKIRTSQKVTKPAPSEKSGSVSAA